VAAYLARRRGITVRARAVALPGPRRPGSGS
jgi:hypothetical protein